MIRVMQGFKDLYENFEDLKEATFKTGGVVERSHSDFFNSDIAMAINSYGIRPYVRTLKGWEVR